MGTMGARLVGSHSTCCRPARLASPERGGCLMGRAVIPVDLRNPGQVFACFGFLEAAEILCSPAMGGFEWDEDERFVLAAEGGEHPIENVLKFLEDATLFAVSPRDELKNNTYKIK